MNFRSIGICLTGFFDVEEPTQEQCEALYKRLLLFMSKYDIPRGKIKPHRAYANKTCWGSLLPDDILGYLETRINNIKGIEANNAILAQRMKIAEKALSEANVVKKYLSKLKDKVFKPYKIVESNEEIG